MFYFFLEQLDDDLKECFLFCGTYGDNVNFKWPRKTVMVYRLKINEELGDYKVIHNDSTNHAEIRFINEVRNSITKQHTKIDIEMFISYSPCDACAQALEGWITELRGEIPGRNVSIAIKFSNFYLEERAGLNALHKAKITLGVFNQNVWGEFFQLIKKKPDGEFQKLIDQRAARETIDAQKLKGII